jgi:hypothetical protein
MRFILLLFLFFGLSLNACPVDNITLKSATAQPWAGGVCCKSGTNYVIQIEKPTSKNELIPEDLWIGDKSFPVSISENEKDGKAHNAIKQVNGKNIEYSFSVGTEYDQSMTNPKGPEPKKDISKPLPIKYAGAALISYHYKGKTKTYYFIVPSFQNMPAQNYP